MTAAQLLKIGQTLLRATHAFLLVAVSPGSPLSTNQKFWAIAVAVALVTLYKKDKDDATTPPVKTETTKEQTGTADAEPNSETTSLKGA
jgi:type III secretory pathway component EscV